MSQNTQSNQKEAAPDLAGNARSSQGVIRFSVAYFLIALYFSYATLTTVGYGGIIPISGGARMLAMAEAMVGVFYVTLLIARLVTLYYSKGPSD